MVPAATPAASCASCDRELTKIVSVAGPPPAHVSAADRNAIEVSAADEPTAAWLTKLGFRPDSTRADVLVLPVADDTDKARVMTELRDGELCFVRAREWCPAEVFEWLRDRGMLKGPFRTISWWRQGTYRLSDEP